MPKRFFRVSPESVGIPSQSVERLLDFLESGVTEPHGLMILRHGNICAEGWWNPYAPGIPHDCRSLSKTFAGTAVGLAVTDGVLSLDDRVVDFFPEFAPPIVSERLSRLKVRHLLSMTVGMEYESLFGENWIQHFLEVPVVYEPGSMFMYNSKGTSICCAIIRKVTGLSVLDYLDQRLYQKIGIRGTNQKWMKLPGDIEMGGGSLFATTEDVLRLMKLYLDGGVWEGKTILSLEFVRLATTAQVDNSKSSDPKYLRKKEQTCGYGYQMWMCSPEGVYRADGAQGQLGIVFSHQDMVVAMHQNCDDSEIVQRYLYEEFLPTLVDSPLPPNPEGEEHLRRRMERLCLPRVPFSPESPWQYKVQGREYCVKKGRFTFFRRFENHGSWKTVTEGIENFSFQFLPRECAISFWENRNPHQVIVALDGSLRWNILPSREHFMEEALFSGAWIQEDTFEVRARWVECTRERTVQFRFVSEWEVEISCFLSQDASSFGRGPDSEILPHPEQAIALAEK